MRTVVLALIVAVAVSLIGNAPGGAARDSLSWKVDPSPFRLTFLNGDAVLLRERLGSPGAGTRLSYRIHEGGGFHSLTNVISQKTSATGAVYTVATTEKDRIATVTVSRIATGLRVNLTLGDGGTHVRTFYESFGSSAAEHFLGTGERRDFVDLRGQIVPIKVWHNCGSAKPAPFFLSSRGYGVRFATPAVGRMAFGNVVEQAGCELGTSPCEIASRTPVVQACFKTTRTLTYEIYTGPPEQIVQAYAAQTGRPPLPAPEQFAMMKWRDLIGSETDLTEDADRFAAAGIPLGWVIVDNPWEVAQCAGSMTFDPKLFPDPAATIARLHARGIRLMMWVSPMVRTVCGRDFYPRNRVYGPAGYQAIDLTDPAVTATFEQRLGTLLASGIDGFKVDRGDEVDLELRLLANGNGNDVHNPYPLLVAQSIDRVARAGRGHRIPTLFRAGFTGAQSLDTAVWSGDLPGDWTGLQQAVRSAQSAGLVGYSTWGSDVGGYVGSPSAEVFGRWAQFGAVSPVFEVGGTGANATPWQLGTAAMEQLRDAAILHYELFPYHYELARRAGATGLSILRPLALQYPADERSWSADREVLVGPDLLAAPVTRPGTTADVYLPPDRWVDLGTGTTRVGPLAIRRRTPADEIPLYLREGAAIPFNLREPAVWSSPWQLNDQFRAGRGGWLVAPGARPATATSVEYGALTATRGTTATTLRLVRARRETQVLVLGKQLPAAITIDGVTVPRSASEAALRRRSQGWMVRAAPYPGVLLKLAPRAGRSLVTIRYPG